MLLLTQERGQGKKLVGTQLIIAGPQKPVNRPRAGHGDRRQHSLGTSVQSSSTREDQAAEYLRDAAKRERYRLQRIAKKLLPEEYDHAFGQCSATPLPEHRFIVGRYNATDQTSTFGGLVHCGSYQCVQCAYWRCEADRHELSMGFAQAKKMGWSVVMITATVRHNMGDGLAELRDGLNKAFNDCFSGRWYKNLVEEWGIQGKVKAWEVTYGESGWHPHLHVLMFFDIQVSETLRSILEAKLTERWLAKLKARGFDASWDHGLKVDTADSKIADYISKFGREPLDKEWGADAEISRAPVKKAHNDGLTPFEVLAAAAGNDEPLWRLAEKVGVADRDLLIRRAGALYREYFFSFKGKPRLYWGKLKQILQLNQAIEDFAAANPPAEKQIIDMVLIDAHTAWHKLLALPDGCADLLAVIRTGDPFIVMVWLADHKINAIIPEAAIEKCIAVEKPEQMPLFEDKGHFLSRKEWRPCPEAPQGSRSEGLTPGCADSGMKSFGGRRFNLRPKDMPSAGEAEKCRSPET